MVKVLFVCLGNICRSPLGEGVFKELVKRNGIQDRFLVDSCGTSAYHIGELPDKRMREVAYSHGVRLESRARQLKAEDLSEFDYILAMDQSNFKHITALEKVSSKAKIFHIREFDEFSNGDLDVPDPYYGSIHGFEEVYQIVDRASKNFLTKVLNNEI